MKRVLVERSLLSATVLGCVAVFGCASPKAAVEPPVEPAVPAVIEVVPSLPTEPPPGYVKPEIYWVREKIILGTAPEPPASATQKSSAKKGKKSKKTG